MRNLFLSTVTAALLFFLFACDNPIPTDALTQAKHMLSKAETVKAQEYAKAEYDEASKLLLDAIDISVDPEKTEAAIKKANESYDKAEEAYFKALKEVCRLLIEDLKKADQDMQDKNIPNLFTDKYNDFVAKFKAGQEAYQAALKADTKSQKYVEAYDKLKEAEAVKDALLADLDDLIAKNLDAIDKADLAIKDAQKNGAEKYASTELNEAVALLKEAEKLKDDLEHHKSIDKAKEAENMAYKALDIAREAQLAAQRQAAWTLLKEAEKWYNKAKVYADKRKDDKKIVEMFQGVEDNYTKAKSYFEDTKYDLSNQFSKETIRLAKILLGTTSSGTYTVRLIPKRRDCLWRIAEYDFIYKNPYKWPVIWKANLNKIEDPDLIFPGQVFSIPGE